MSSRYDSEGRTFESFRAHLFADVLSHSQSFPQVSKPGAINV
jgi:hypothetical protein